MNYRAHYDRLIFRARGRALTGYKERHHVLPRCMDGGDEPENLVDLTAEEHYVAHQLLTKIYPNVNGLATAAVRMAKQCTGNKAYGWLRVRHSKMMSNRMLGMKMPPRTPEWRAQQSIAMQGRKATPEAREKMSSSQTGRITSTATRAKLSAALRGREFTPEWRAKIGLSKKGNKNCLGMIHSKETKDKISAYQQERRRLLANRSSAPPPQNKV